MREVGHYSLKIGKGQTSQQYYYYVYYAKSRS